MSSEQYFGGLGRQLDAASTNGTSHPIPAPPMASEDAQLLTNVPTLEELERVHIRYVLERVRWHQGRAATVLGISSKTLYRKIRQYGFHRPHVPPSTK